MKGIITIKNCYFKLLIIILLLVFLSACDGITPTSPIINSFTADSMTIEEGDSVTLTWIVTDADTVILNPGGFTVALSGSTSVTPIETSTYTLTATNSAGSSTTTISIIVNPIIIEQTIAIQPGSAEGKDSYINSLLPGYNYASNNYLAIGKSTFSTLGVIRNNDRYSFDYFYRAYLQFNPNAIPADAVIVSADLKLFQSDAIVTVDLTIDLHQVTESWEESTITWDNQPDYLATPESTITVVVGEISWLSWNVTNLLQGWLDGSIANHGIMLKHTGALLANTVVNCYSSDELTGTGLRPKLVITYYVP